MTRAAAPARTPITVTEPRRARRPLYSYEAACAAIKPRSWSNTKVHPRRLRLCILIDRAFATFERDRVLSIDYAAKVIGVGPGEIVQDLHALEVHNVLNFTLLDVEGSPYSALIVEPGAAPVIRCSPATLCRWGHDHVQGATALPPAAPRKECAR